MDLFSPIFNQMLFLFAFIVIGYILSKGKLVPEETASALSKLESLLFVPALLMNSFIENCTIEKLAKTWQLFLLSLAMMAITLPLGVALSKLCFKEKYLKNIAAYGLSFANFGYMGNALVASVFPTIFLEYVIYTLPMNMAIYAFAVPVFLMSNDETTEKMRFSKRMKNMLNPMFIGMFIGLLIGITGAGKWFTGEGIFANNLGKIIKVAGDCMSPVAMLLTGLVIGKVNLPSILKKRRIYLVTALRLIAIPLLFIGIFAILPRSRLLDETFLLCAMCSLAMPLGLNSVIVPAAYGKDTTDAAGMILISHALSIITIPLIFLLFQAVVL